MICVLLIFGVKNETEKCFYLFLSIMVYYEAVVNNIKNIAMEVDTLCGQWKSGRTNRRFSLFDRSETKPNSSREFIETRYRKFFQSIRKSDLESSNSLEASTMERSFEV